MTITPGVNIIKQQNIYFIYYLSSICWFISFLHFNIFKIQFYGVPSFALCSGLQNTYLHAKDDNFKPGNINILFLHKICQLLVYNMFHSHVNSNLAPIPCTRTLKKLCKDHSSSRPISTQHCISIPPEKKCNTGLK